MFYSEYNSVKERRMSAHDTHLPECELCGATMERVTIKKPLSNELEWQCPNGCEVK